MDAMEREPVCVVLPPERELLAGGQCQALRDSMMDGWFEVEKIEGWHVGIRYPSTLGVTADRIKRRLPAWSSE